MLLNILQHTPTWVLIVLLILIWRGISLARPSEVTLQRATILPLVMAALSFSGILTSFGTPIAFAAWACGMAGSLFIGISLKVPQGASYHSSSQTFFLKGSWVPLMLMMTIFCVKFAVAVNLGMHAELRGDPAFIAGASLVYGILSGAFLARSAGLMLLARRSRTMAFEG